MQNIISSMQHPDVKLVKILTRRKGRSEHNLFIIEGIRFIEEAVCAGAPLVKVYFTRRMLQLERGAQLVDKLISQGIAVQEVVPQVLEKMADTEQPQGILATVHMLKPALNVLPYTQTVILVCDKIRDPGNLGTIIRTADAAGVHAVFTTTGTVDLYNTKVLRSTMGSIFHLPIFTEMDTGNIMEILTERGIIPIGATLTARQWYFDADFSRSIAFWLGNEAFGIEKNVIARFPECVKIPMAGHVESLNVAMAASILMFECVRQRMTRN